MKEKEFDELIRQQFEQNDFEYKPANWAQLKFSLENKKGGRKNLLWIPLAILGTVTSVAASIAMMVALPSFFNHNTKTIAEIASYESSNIHIHSTTPAAPIASPLSAKASPTTNPIDNSTEPFIPTPVLHYNGTLYTFTYTKNNTQEPISTFKKVPASPSQRTNDLQDFKGRHLLEINRNEIVWLHKTSISIASSFNYGAYASGYSIVANGRKMLNDKFYIEGDIAFVSNTATERFGYTPLSPSTKSMSSQSSANNTSNAEYEGNNGGLQSTYNSIAFTNSHSQGYGASNGPYMAARTTGSNTSGNSVPDPGTPNVVSPNFTMPEEHNTVPSSGPFTREDSYNLYYAQISPSFGFHCTKLLSIGLGGDLQHLILQGHSNLTTDNTGAIKQIPGMDMGFIGKTELTVNKKIKAGLSYRQGLNNFIAGGNKYVDRSYLQFQLKYMIFKK